MEDLSHPFLTDINELLEHAHRLELELVRTQELFHFGSIELGELRRRYDALRAAAYEDRRTIATLSTELTETAKARASSEASLQAEIRSLADVQAELRSRLAAAQDTAAKIAEDRNVWRDKVATDLPAARAELEQSLRRCRHLEARFTALEAASTEREKELAMVLHSAQSAAEGARRETTAVLRCITELETKLEDAEDQSAGLKDRFLAQTEEIIEQLRVEREQFEMLAQIVRTSKFWKLKNFFRRKAADYARSASQRELIPHSPDERAKHAALLR